MNSDYNPSDVHSQKSFTPSLVEKPAPRAGKALGEAAKLMMSSSKQIPIVS